MATEFIEVEVFVLVDADGDYRTGHDEESVNELFNSDLNSDGARRMVKVVLQVPKPTAVVLRGEVPAEPEGEIELTVEA